jgi:hypothetical protein
MPAELSKERLRELYLPPSDKFVFVEVPDMQFLMIDGEGNPEGERHRLAVKWLFTVIHPIKRMARERMRKEFLEPPLEGLWWADDLNDLVAGDKDKLKWRMMIVTADWVSNDMFEQAAATASQRLGEVPASLRLDRFREGRCVQIMHLGDYRREAAGLVRRLHHEILPGHGLVARGHHHEIYLTDPGRVAPEKMRTVVRQPVKDTAA